jgi:hypothetical protein
MAVRIVYVLNNKAPDVIPAAKSWYFSEGMLRIIGERGRNFPMIEIRGDFVLSVEHVDLEDDAKEAPEEPEEAPEGTPKPRKREKKAS